MDILPAERTPPSERKMKALWTYLQCYWPPMEQPECRCEKREQADDGQPGKDRIGRIRAKAWTVENSDGEEHQKPSGHQSDERR